MAIFEKEVDGCIVSTEQSLLDLSLCHFYISNSYWAKGIPFHTFEKSIKNSLCFGIYINKKQIGLARVVSDLSTFAYLADVFIVDEEKGKGYAKTLISTLMEHPDLQGLRRFCLGTKDAHSLYSRYGFAPIKIAENWMEIRHSDIYLKNKS